MLNCIIIEDQPPAQRILKQYIAVADILTLKATFSDVIKASEYMKTNDVGLIFLDIHLPIVSGIDFLKNMPVNPKTILTTAFPDYALESYHYNVVDYLLKPFSEERFLRAINKLKKGMGEEKPSETGKTIFIKIGHELIQIKISDILFIKSDSDYTEITMVDKRYLSNEPLRHWLAQLGGDSFCQVHRSYLLNLRHLKRVSGNVLHLANTTLPLGRAYKKTFLEQHLR